MSLTLRGRLGGIMPFSGAWFFPDSEYRLPELLVPMNAFTPEIWMKYTMAEKHYYNPVLRQELVLKYVGENKRMVLSMDIEEEQS